MLQEELLRHRLVIEGQMASTRVRRLVENSVAIRGAEK